MNQFRPAVGLGLIDRERPAQPLPWVYTFTENEGWIDMGHFLTGARAAARYPGRDGLLLLLGQLYENYTAEVGRQDPDRPGFGSSAHTPEDAISNRLGVRFGGQLKKDVPLSQQLREFFGKLNAKPPRQAWNFRMLPRTEEEWETCWRNAPEESMKRARIVLDRNHQLWKIHPPDSPEVQWRLQYIGIWRPLSNPLPQLRELEMPPGLED